MVLAVEHDLQARKSLGRQIRNARKAAGLSDTKAWAAKVGRSDRMLLGLERGEAVGADTYAAVSAALPDWPLNRIYAVLEGREAPASLGSAPPALADVSAEELVAEVLRRIKTGGGRRGDESGATTEGRGLGSRLDEVAERTQAEIDAERTESIRHAEEGTGA